MRIAIPTNRGKKYIYADNHSALFQEAWKSAPPGIKQAMYLIFKEFYVGSLREICSLADISMALGKSWIKGVMAEKFQVVSEKKYSGMSSAFYFSNIEKEVLSARLKEFEERRAAERREFQKKGKEFETETVKDFSTLLANSKLHIDAVSWDHEPFDFVAKLSIELPFFGKTVKVGMIPISCKNARMGEAYTSKMLRCSRNGRALTGNEIPRIETHSVLLCRSYNGQHNNVLVFDAKKLEIIKKFREGIENANGNCGMRQSNSSEADSYID